MNQQAALIGNSTCKEEIYDSPVIHPRKQTARSYDSNAPRTGQYALRAVRDLLVQLPDRHRCSPARMGKQADFRQSLPELRGMCPALPARGDPV